MATENTHKKTLTPVYICHGAEGDQCHVLSLKPGGESPWGTHQFSCQEIVGDPSSLIGVEPKRGEYQAFPVTGAAFKIHCPASGPDRDMELRLISEFTAQPFGIALKLGHYRCVLADKRPPIGAPIVGQKVTASVTVESFYTRALATNIDVMWTVGGEEVAVPTNSSGVSEFNYTVAKAGKQIMTASLYNPYNDETIIEEFSFTGYASSPWEQASLSVNGNEVKFGDPVVLIRGQANEVVVGAPPEIARQISLGLADAGGLTIEASPDFGSLVDPVAGKFTWRLTSGAGKSGNVALVIHSHEVELPWELRCVVMSANLADEVEVKIGGALVPASGNIFFRGHAQVVTLTPKAGSPIAGHPVTMRRTVESPLLLTDVEAVPPPDTAQTNHVWQVTGSNRSGVFQLNFFAAGISGQINVPESTLLSVDLNDEVNVMLDGEEILPGAAGITGGKTATLNLIYINGDLLKNMPLALDALLEPDLVAGDITSVPALRQLSSVHEWKLTGAKNKQGEFKLALFNEGEKAKLITPSIRLSGGKNFAFQKGWGDEEVALPIPPAKLSLKVTDDLPCQVRLKDSDGKPIPGVGVDMFAEDQDVTGITDVKGAVRLQFTFYPFGAGEYVVKAVAKFPEGDTTIELIVDVR